MMTSPYDKKVSGSVLQPLSESPSTTSDTRHPLSNGSEGTTPSKIPESSGLSNFWFWN